jgi:hypothetical protein
MKKITAVALMVLIVQSCNLHSKDETLLAEHKQSNGGKVNIYLVSVGATANDNMQVRKSGQDSPIWVSERYDTLLSSKLINDTAMELIVSAKGIHGEVGKVDTLHVAIK